MPRGRVEKYPEAYAYIRKHANVHVTRTEMLERVRHIFNKDISFENVKRVYTADNLPFCKSNCNRLVTEEQALFLIEIIPGRSSVEISRLFEEKYGAHLTAWQVRTWKKNHKTPSGYSARFRKGQRSWTQGKKWSDYMSPEGQVGSRKTCYKKGNIPANWKPLGSISERDGYLMIKTRDGHGVKNWEFVHQKIWKEANGPIPKHHKIIFLDGNRYNCKIENLYLISNEAFAVANRLYKLTDDPDLNKTIIAAAELRIKANEAERKRKERKRNERRKKRTDRQR